MPPSPHSINGLVERQMRNWEIRRAQVPPAAAPEVPAVRPFVTISRMVGSGGLQVARRLEELTGWPLFDRELLTHMAGDDHVRKRLYETMDERDVSFIEETLRSFTAPEFRRNDFLHRLSETMLALARKGSAIFLGRGADLILPRTLGVRVRVIAIPAVCVQQYAAARGLDAVMAAREVERIERERTRFLRSSFRTDPNSPDRFDLQLNLSALSIEEAAQTILALMRLRKMV